MRVKHCSSRPIGFQDKLVSITVWVRIFYSSFLSAGKTFFAYWRHLRRPRALHFWTSFEKTVCISRYGNFPRIPKSSKKKSCGTLLLVHRCVALSRTHEHLWFLSFTAISNILDISKRNFSVKAVLANNVIKTKEIIQRKLNSSSLHFN